MLVQPPRRGNGQAVPIAQLRGEERHFWLSALLTSLAVMSTIWIMRS